MATKEQKMINLSKKLIIIRKKPILILDLKEVEFSICLKLQRILFGKHFKEIDIILQTPGGDIDAAFNIIKLLRHSSDIVNILVPLFSKSAGTLICLGADKLILTTLSELGPLDTQIREQQEDGPPAYRSALNGFKALEQVQLHTLETMDVATKLILNRSGMKISEAIKLATGFSGNTSGTLYQQVDPKKIGEYARALEIGERYGITVLTRYMKWNMEEADLVVKKLVKGYPAHGFIIDAEELNILGLPAEDANPQEEEILDELRLELLKTKGNIIELLELPKVATKKVNPKEKSKSGDNNESEKK